MKAIIPPMNTPWTKKLALALAACAVFILPCQADSYATIAGNGDSVTLHAGETALLVAGSGVFTYSKVRAGQPYQPCSYIRLSANRSRTLRETSLYALPLVGPCVITVRCPDGYLGMRIVSTGVRPVTEQSRVASVPPKFSAVRP